MGVRSDVGTLLEVARVCQSSSNEIDIGSTMGGFMNKSVSYILILMLNFIFNVRKISFKVSNFERFERLEEYGVQKLFWAMKFLLTRLEFCCFWEIK